MTDERLEDTPEYIEGLGAQRAGLGRDQDPHRGRDSQRSHRWQAGWEQAARDADPPPW